MKRVLIVDDEQDVLNVLEKRLSGEGYVVSKASSGREAIEIAKRETPNLIVLDVVMPDMDGGSVAQVLREDERTKDIPIVFLSCLYTKKDEEKGGHSVGKNFFIAKPYNPAEFLSIIREQIK